MRVIVYGCWPAMPVVSISLPETLLEKIDSVVRRYGYTGRSELIRDAIREYLARLEVVNERELVNAVILVVTDHDVSQHVDQKVIEIVHEHQTLIKSFHHQFLDENTCLNIAVVRASIAEIQAMLKEIRRTRGVRRVWLTLL